MKLPLPLDKIKLYAVMLWIALSAGVLVFGIHGFSKVEDSVEQITDTVLIDLDKFALDSDGQRETVQDADIAASSIETDNATLGNATELPPSPEPVRVRKDTSAADKSEEESTVEARSDVIAPENTEPESMLHPGEGQEVPLLKTEPTADKPAENNPAPLQDESSVMNEQSKNESPTISNSTVLLALEKPASGPAQRKSLYKVQYIPDPENFSIRLKADPEVHSYSYFFMDSPARLVVDIKGEHWRCLVKRMQGFDEGFISKVIIGEHEKFMRFVIHYRDTALKLHAAPAFAVLEGAFLIELPAE